MPISRLYDFTPNTLIQSGQVDDELNQLVAEVNLKLPLVGGTISGNLTVGGTLGVTGAVTLSSTLGVTGATTVGALTINGALDFSSGSINAGSANKVVDAYTRPTGASVGARGVAISASSGTFSTTSTSYVDVTNLSVTITVTSRPVLIWIGTAATGGNVGDILISSSSDDNISADLKILRDSTEVGSSRIGIQDLANGAIQCGVPTTFITLDSPGAGTFVYKIQAKCNFASMTVNVRHSKLFVVEL